jgi:AraC family transcriptional regulator
MIYTTPFESAIAGSELRSNRKSRRSGLPEATVWQPVAQGWRQLYGAYYELGVSIEWHDFELGHPFEWSRSFHPGSLELCLNLTGNGTIRCYERVTQVLPLTATFYLPGEQRLGLQAWRDARYRHRFITVEFSARFLQDKLASCDGALNPLVEAFVRSDQPPAPAISEPERLTSTQEQMIAVLLDAPVPQRARPLWYQSKVLQVMAEFFFQRQGEDEFFCDRQKRLARERVAKVVSLLAENLAEPLSLEEIGCRVGCSPFHLSRTFSAETGTTIPQYLRKLRMEKAADLLRTGKCNVTEAAFAVGYSSLSHFSQVFCQIMGCCPGLYPLKKSNQAAL